MMRMLLSEPARCSAAALRCTCQSRLLPALWVPIFLVHLLQPALADPPKRERPPTPSRLLAHQQAEQQWLGARVLFDDGSGMHAAPGAADIPFALTQHDNAAAKFVRARLTADLGVLFNQERHLIGMANVDRDGMPLAVLGCAVCHAGKVLGRIVPGLGNKNIDPYQIGLASERLHMLYDHLPHGYRDHPDFARFAAGAAGFHQKSNRPRLANLTQGMVSTGHVLASFYEQADEPLPDDFARAAVKVPPLWGYLAKRKAGLFCDGSGKGEPVGWLIGALLPTVSNPAAVEVQLPLLEHMAGILGKLLPPAYPLTVNQQLAARGRILYTDHCSQCHGTYRRDAGGLPLFEPPRWIPYEQVQTDRDRLHNANQDFATLAAQSPLRPWIQVREDRIGGYLAPRLEGIWARFPYLHNGSVPNLMALLSRPQDRPRIFDLHGAGETYRFDPQRLGLTVPAAGSSAALRLRWRASLGARNVYDTSRSGHSSQGHDFGTDLASEQKRALIEYLKTL